MTEKVKLIFILFSGIALASCSLVNPAIDPPNSSQNTFIPETELSQLEKEYSQFRTMSLSQPYLAKKLNKWKADANDNQMVREIEFSRIKHPNLYCTILTDVANSALKTYIDDKNTNNTGAFLSKKNESPAFATFLVTKGCPNLLLDNFTGASLAYSLRKLSVVYNGSAVRVRRSSDNSEQNIGFVNNTLDTTTLQSFVGSGDGYIITWYDQSGNARNATQSVVNRQPVLVSSGVVLTNLSKPSIKFVSGSIQNLVNSSFNLPQPNSAYAVAHYAGTTGQNYIFDSANSSKQLAILRNQSTGLWDFYAGTELFGPATVTGNYLVEGYFKTTNSKFYLNSNLAASGNPGSWGLEGITIGNYAGVNNPVHAWGSFINEIIIYNSDEQANRAGITTNINGYYSVY